MFEVVTTSIIIISIQYRLLREMGTDHVNFANILKNANKV